MYFHCQVKTMLGESPLAVATVATVASVASVATGKLLFGSKAAPGNSDPIVPSMAAAPRTVAEGTKRVKKGLPAMLKGRSAHQRFQLETLS